LYEFVARKDTTRQNTYVIKTNVHVHGRGFLCKCTEVTTRDKIEMNLIVGRNYVMEGYNEAEYICNKNQCTCV